MHLARRHPELVAGLVVEATGLEWSGTRRERLLWRFLPIVGSWLRSRGYRRYLNRAVPKVIGAGHALEPYVPWLVSEMSRNDCPRWSTPVGPCPTTTPARGPRR